MCSLRRSSAWADTATARFFPREERFSGTGSRTFPKVRQGGLPALPSTLESPRDLVKPCKLLGLARGELGAHLSISTPLPKFFWGTSAGWRRGSSSRSRKKPLPSSTKRGSPFRTAEHVVGETITPLPPDTQFLIVFKDARQAGGALSGELAQVLDCDLTPPVPAADPPPHTPQPVLGSLSPLKWLLGKSHAQVRLPDPWLRSVLKPGPWGKLNQRKARGPRVGGSSAVMPPPTPDARLESSPQFQGEPAAPPHPLPERVRIAWHPAPGAVAGSSRNLGLGGYPTPRRFSGAAKASQPHSREDWSRQPKQGSAGVLQTHPHLHTPIRRAKGTRFLAPNSGSHPSCPSGRVVGSA